MAETEIIEPIPAPELPTYTPPPVTRVQGLPALAANAEKEYVAAGAFPAFIAQYYTTLPRFLDDVEQQIGSDTYTRMLTDPQVFSDVHIIKQAVTSQELQLSAAVGEEDPDYETATEYKGFCERCIERLPHFRTGFLYEMLDAIAFGHRLAEQVLEIATSGQDAGRIVPAALKVKPRTSYAFVVDAYLNVVGILGIVPGLGYSPLMGLFGYDAKALAETLNLLPRAKFAILSLLTKSGDPRGGSWLRSCYNSWFLKQQIFPDYSRYLAQFASPSVWAELPPNAGPTPEVDANGNPVLDANGNPIINDPTQAMTKALLAFHNGTALVVPHGTKVSTLFTYQNGEAFRFAVDMLNREINQGMLFQSLATMEAQHGTRAAAQTHQDVLELPIQHVRTATEEMIRRDLLTLWIRLNFGEDAVRLTPKCNLGDTEEQNFAQKGMTIARMHQSGYFDPSQLLGVDVELGLPRRTPEEVQTRQDERKAALESIQAAQMQPPGAGQPAAAAKEVVPQRELQADVRA